MSYAEAGAKHTNIFSHGATEATGKIRHKNVSVYRAYCVKNLLVEYLKKKYPDFSTHPEFMASGTNYLIVFNLYLSTK